MILNESEYNPLERVFAVLDGPTYNVEALDEIKKELFKAGVVPETDGEFNTVLELLVDINPKKYVK